MTDKQKQCYFCTANTQLIDYKDTETLKKYMSPQARILGRRRTNTCARHQRQLARAIKHARQLGLVAFTIR